jgi:hypothetical protein
MKTAYNPYRKEHADNEDDLFMEYCRTGQHPARKMMMRVPVMPPLSCKERELHALAEACTCPIARDVIGADKIHVAYLERKYNRNKSMKEVTRKSS